MKDTCTSQWRLSLHFRNRILAKIWLYVDSSKGSATELKETSGRYWLWKLSSPVHVTNIPRQPCTGAILNLKSFWKQWKDVPFHHHPALGKIQPEERSDKIFISHIAMGLTIVKRFPKNLIFLSRLQAINFLVLLKNKTLIFKEGSFLK